MLLPSLFSLKTFLSWFLWCCISYLILLTFACFPPGSTSLGYLLNVSIPELLSSKLFILYNLPFRNHMTSFHLWPLTSPSAVIFFPEDSRAAFPKLWGPPCYHTAWPWGAHTLWYAWAICRHWKIKKFLTDLHRGLTSLLNFVVLSSGNTESQHSGLTTESIADSSFHSSYNQIVVWVLLPPPGQNVLFLPFYFLVHHSQSLGSG